MTLISVLYQSVHMRSGGRHFFRAAFDRECEKADRKKKNRVSMRKKTSGHCIHLKVLTELFDVNIFSSPVRISLVKKKRKNNYF